MLLTSLFSNFVLPCCFQPPPAIAHSVSSAEWVIAPHFYLMLSWMYTCQASGPWWSWCMFYATRLEVLECTLGYQPLSSKTPPPSFSLSHTLNLYWFFINLYIGFSVNSHNFSSLIPSHLLKVTKFLVKISV